MTAKTELEKKLLGSKLWSIWLWICIVLSALADVNVLISLSIQGISFKYIIFPLVLIVLDLALAACAAISNFRFRHSLIAPIIYGVFTVVVTLVFWIWFSATASYVIFTNTAFVMWIVMQLLTVAVTILSAIRASGSGFIMRLIVFICAIIYIAYGLAYIILVGEGGFFGQAGDGYSGYSGSLRTLGYTYNDSTDSYTASSVLSGNGDTVVVPEEFNGKKVTAISSGILQNNSISTVVLESSESLSVTGISGINARRSSLKIYAQPSQTDYYRNLFYGLAESYDTSGSGTYTSYGNDVKPITEEGQCYISFTYTYDSLKTANFEALSTIILDEGATFTANAITDSYDYMTYSNEQSESDRYNSYETNEDHMMLSELMYTSTDALIGSAITSSKNVAVNFTTVYRISVLEDNDDVYTLPDSLRYYGSTQYRYVTADTCTDILGGLEGRTGFTYTWEYYMTAGSTAAAVLDDFSDVLYDGIRIFPVWELEAPAAPSITGTTSITYGDTLSLTAVPQTDSRDSWLTYSYNWSTSGSSSLSTSKTYANSTITPADSGTYTLYVTISAPDKTSLTNSSTASVYVSVAKKSLSFIWSDDAGGMTYDGTAKTISATANTNQVVGSDSITFNTYNYTYTNAGSYTASITLTGTCASLYTAANNTYSYTISQAPVSFTWSDTEFTYDGDSHIATYDVSGVVEGDDLGVSYSATAKTNAGTYSNSVSISNGNYYISEGQTFSYTINKAPVALVWGSTELTYCGTAQTPTVTSATGLVGSQTISVLNITYSAGETNVGTGYEVTASISATNYKLADSDADNTCTYSIAAYELAVSWGSTSLTYNGTEQAPAHTYAISKLGNDTISDSLLAATVSGSAKDVGTSYEATLSI
ncbi:MAG: hypothetical protein LUD50_00310, partial [Clostridia bacterium]|nr:hypothetical protein [Clostridia bacterium]